MCCFSILKVLEHEVNVIFFTKLLLYSDDSRRLTKHGNSITIRACIHKSRVPFLNFPVIIFKSGNILEGVMTRAVHPFPHMTCTNLLKIYAWKTFVCNDVFSARHGNFTFFNSSYALTTCIYTCHHNKLFLERKNNANIKIKENNSLPFLCIFRRQPHWTQSESVMGKKVLYIHLYLERYARLSKVPKISRLYTAGQTDHSFSTAGNVIKSNKKESIS